ncbi:MAG: aminotransferase class I/II-fold pyridoxal phosphate-dependent enzyme, partial [Campylobacteraceae bacterium]|nr:aminotransferase class I/II-fold pyridoxal phosphate-dependent enzyme [Campylobacteraceae bacterium]
MTNFDKIIDRNNTRTYKIDRYKKYKNAIPMWVADMDFESPKCVIKALKKRVNHKVYGYTLIDSNIKQTIKKFLKKHHNFEIKNSSLVFTSGVVASMNIVCNMLTKKDSVITSKPIYPYFFTTPEHFGQKVVHINMKNIDNRWMFDFDELESK